MRGTPDLCRALAVGEGIIPAYAGNTRYGTPCTALRRDHPRVCGEHRTNATGADDQKGSSPRMRGTRHPAFATCGPNRDHPRVCGEHLFDGERACCGMGSSPRMRGTPNPRRSAPRRRGIIPAYAGNTSNSWWPVSASRDHPRVCGEHPMSNPLVHRFLGSSPRMRGTHRSWCTAGKEAGIIPAYAGNTYDRGYGDFETWDHPRVCGEHHRRCGTAAHA